LQIERLFFSLTTAFTDRNDFKPSLYD